jgi:hypothetical protein
MKTMPDCRTQTIQEYECCAGFTAINDDGSSIISVGFHATPVFSESNQMSSGFDQFTCSGSMAGGVI